MSRSARQSLARDRREKQERWERSRAVYLATTWHITSRGSLLATGHCDDCDRENEKLCPRCYTKVFPWLMDPFAEAKLGWGVPQCKLMAKLYKVRDALPAGGAA